MIALNRPDPPWLRWPEVETDWETPARTAEMLELTERRLRDLERIGLPSRGTGRDKRYPFGGERCAFTWYYVYRLLFDETVGHPPARLTMEQAFERKLRIDARSRAYFHLRRATRGEAQGALDWEAEPFLGEAQQMLHHGAHPDDDWPSGVPWIYDHPAWQWRDQDDALPQPPGS